MKIYRLDSISCIPKNIACIGYFDGVHLAHQKLIKETINIAKRKDLLPIIISFFPDPETVISNKDVKQITTLDERLRLFEKYGINNCLLFDFDKKFMNIEAFDFINNYLLKANIDTIVCGYDFKFGKNAKGDSILLKEFFNVEEIEKITFNDIKISSTYIRQLLNEGNYQLARQLLGHE